jgi:hypothetical protein
VILATTKPGATRAEVQAWMKAMGASEFTHPSSVAVLDAIPVLGSGKTNYVALKATRGRPTSKTSRPAADAYPKSRSSHAYFWDRLPFFFTSARKGSFCAG